MFLLFTPVWAPLLMTTTYFFCFSFFHCSCLVRSPDSQTAVTLSVSVQDSCGVQQYSSKVHWKSLTVNKPPTFLFFSALLREKYFEYKKKKYDLIKCII